MNSMISVVIPCYNRSTFLKRAIDSALAQTARASEVIVVDDGSTDNTREVCAGYGNQIEYVWQKNAGSSAARNTGVSHARNRWVAFLDSDDYWTTSHLARMASALEETGGEARFYFSDMQFGENNHGATLWKRINFAPPQPIQLARDGTDWAFLKRQPFMLQCSVFCRDAWLATGGLDPRFRVMEDPELFFRLSIGGKVCAVSGVACIQTDDDASSVRLTTAMHPKGAPYWHEAIALRKRVLSQFPNLPRKYRTRLEFGLASSRWRLIRVHWSSKHLCRTAWHLTILGCIDPRFLISRLFYRGSRAKSPSVLPEYN
jgi:glycosyltransferase involved in cell wall biosynthesis